MSNLKLVGDISPTGRRIYHIGLPYAQSSICLANLECPITAGKVPRAKAGPSLSANPECVELFRKGGSFICSLANNHIMDYGEQGILDTIEACRRVNVQGVGAGVNLAGAQTPALLEIQGVSIGVIGCCETQFGIASEQRAGVSPISPKIYQQIRELQEHVDIVIVSVHGAAEMSPWPSPQWQDLLRSFIDAGASIVHGHHSHVPQGYEEYHEGFIFYGTGNFLVEPARWRDTPNALWSLIGDVTLSGGGGEELLVKTAVIEDNECVVVRESNDREATLHQEYLARANHPLLDRKLLTGLWQESSIRMYHLWNAKWLGFEPETVRLGLKGKLRNLMRDMYKSLFGYNHGRGVSISQDDLLLWYHLFACESHRDSIAMALGVLSGELEDMRTDETCALADEMMPWSIEESK